MLNDLFFDLLFRLWESFQGCQFECEQSDCMVDFLFRLLLNTAPPLSSVFH